MLWCEVAFWARLVSAWRAAPRVVPLACAVMLLALLAPIEARAEIVEGRRVALVVGNGAYEHVEALANPINDSTALAERLRKLEFEVFDGRDLSLSAMRRLVDRFVKEAQTADTAVVYYSGHAFQMRGLNYLVPTDAKLETKAAIAVETMRLDTLLSDLEGLGRQVLAFLDACRNNPLPPGQRRGDGLAQVQTGRDVFVAFATSPGNVSYDGRGKHSPFTQGLVDHLGTPGQSVSDMMIEVRNSVEAHTLHKQTPWDQSSLRRQVYFNPDDGDVVQLASLGTTSVSRDDAILSTPRTMGPIVAPVTGAVNPDAGDAQPDEPNPVEATASPAEETPAPEIASLDTPIDPLGSVTSGATNPIIVTVPDLVPGVLEGEELVFAVQEELKRIGCYRSTVDGIWGRGSRAAAANYLKTKKVNADAAEPTDFLLQALKAEKGEICAPPPPPKRITPRRTRPEATVNRAPSRKARPAQRARTKKAAPRRAAAPRRTARRAAPARAAAPKKKSLSGAKLTGGFR